MMKKRQKVIYWIATLWLALGMTSTGIVQLLKPDEEVQNFLHLGYPGYLLSLIGGWKLLGVIVILILAFPLIKEWAYAGFFFTMSGAIISHLAIGDPVKELFPPLLLLVLTMTSWYFRPAGRKIILVNLNQPSV